MARILIIDDSPEVRAFMYDALSSVGHEVTVAQSGLTGIALFEQNCPDCVIVDIVMEDFDGIAVIKRIRSHNATTPIIVASGYGPHIRKSALGRIGATNFLDKPFQASELCKHVTDTLQECASHAAHGK